MQIMQKVIYCKKIINCYTSTKSVIHIRKYDYYLLQFILHIITHILIYTLECSCTLFLLLHTRTVITFCLNELVNYISLVAPMRATVSLYIGVTDPLLSYIVFVFFHVNILMHICYIYISCFHTILFPCFYC